jgi:Fe-S cluster biogenesis protein NfuA
MDEALVRDALDEVRPSLEADGFDLRLGSLAADGAIEVVLEATGRACLDCLVPDDMLVAILQAAMRSRNPQAGPVTLTKLGFE